MKRLNENFLRQLIREEKAKANKRMPSLSSLLFEQDEDKGKESFMLAGKPVGEPKGTAFTSQTNFADFKSPEDCREVFAQILSGDSSQPIFKSMEFTEKDSEGKESVKKPDSAKIVAWLKDKSKNPGLDELAKRIISIGSKLPTSGIPKNMMPFLPGPPDAKGSVDQVEDALTPGGELNVDFKESRKIRDDLIVVERWQKLAGILSEKVEPPAPNTFLGMEDEKAKEYMTSGLKDGKPEDDKATFKKNVTIAASDAIPTQKNVLLPKTIGMAANGIKGGPIGAYFSANNEILDGHHRWSATMLNDPGASIGGFAAVDLDAMGGKEQGLMHLTAIGNALGNKTKTV